MAGDEVRLVLARQAVLLGRRGGAHRIGVVEPRRGDAVIGARARIVDRVALHVAANRADFRGEWAVVLAPVTMEFPDLETAPANDEFDVLDPRRRLRPVLDQMLDREYRACRGVIAEA